MAAAGLSLSFGAVLAGCGMVAGGLLLASQTLGGGWQAGLSRRLKDLQHDYQGMAGADEASNEQGAPKTILQGATLGLDGLSRALGRFSLINLTQQEKLRGLLLQCGVRRPEAPRRLMALKALGLVLGTALGLFVVGEGQLGSGWWGTAVAGGGLTGTMLPEFLLKRRAKARLGRIARRLPDALDLLIIFANAGYGMDQAIQRLSVEMHRSAPDLSDEFAIVSDELRLLADRNQALENMAARTGLRAVRNLVSTLVQAQKYGTPLSQALRVLAAEERKERITELEERAGRQPVLITLPVIGLILPAILLVLCTPAVLQASRTLPAVFGDGGH